MLLIFRYEMVALFLAETFHTKDRPYMYWRSIDDLCLSGKTDPWSIRSAWPTDHVAGWEPSDLNGLQ